MSLRYTHFHGAFPQALCPLTLGLTVILQDRHHHQFIGDRLAPAFPSLPAHCLSYQAQGGGIPAWVWDPQPGSGSLHHAALHSGRMLLFFSCHQRNEHKMGCSVRLICGSVCPDWGSQAQGEETMTDFTLTTPT